MRLLSCLVVALAADYAVASSWFGKAVYSDWDKTELQRWLADHDIAYPKAADSEELKRWVKENWHSNVVQPYARWDARQLQTYLTGKGQEVKKGTEKNKDSLIEQVKGTWTETEEQATESYVNVKDWIFNSWSDSQLKAFLDSHGIPNPQPHTRDTLLKTARENYNSAATKVGQTVAYPGNWVYESWSDSDIKAWLDERGIPAPQPSSRDKLVAAVRRNSRLASNKLAAAASSASASAASAQASISDAIFDSWSDSELKAWADKNGIKVPQGSKRNEVIALARKHRAKLTGDNIASSASSYLSAATSSAGNQYAKATDEASHQSNLLLSYVDGCVQWAKHQLGFYGTGPKASVLSASASASKSAVSAGYRAAESASSVKHKASEAAQKATNRAKQEL